MDHAHKHPAQLSGGQQQRVAIARALVHASAAGAVRRAHGLPRPGDGERGAADHGEPGRRRHDDDRRHARDGVRAPRGGPRDFHGPGPDHRDRAARTTSSTGRKARACNPFSASCCRTERSRLSSPPIRTTSRRSPMSVIDVHTHMFTAQVARAAEAGGRHLQHQDAPRRPAGNLPRRHAGRDSAARAISTTTLRIKHMDAAGIDISIVSLTCPNVYWGNEDVSCRAARESNDTMAEAQIDVPGSHSLVHVAALGIPAAGDRGAARARAATAPSASWCWPTSPDAA